MRFATLGCTVLATLASCQGTIGSTLGISTGGGAAGTKLAFTVEPATARAGFTISPAIQVAVQTSGGGIDTAFAGAVTVAIGTNPAAGSLAGTTTIAATAGVATFNNLSINTVGTGYTLTARTPTLTSATSTAFNITP